FGAIQVLLELPFLLLLFCGSINFSFYLVFQIKYRDLILDSSFFAVGQCLSAYGKTSVNKGNEECSTSRLQSCMNLLQTINKDHNLAFASTEEELLNMCSTMNTGFECVYDHVTRCFNKERRDLIYTLLQGTEDVIRLLCTPGDFRNNYKIHAPCMKNVSTDSRMCGPHYQMLIRLVSPKDDVSVADTIRRQCWHLHLIRFITNSCDIRSPTTHISCASLKLLKANADRMRQILSKIIVTGPLDHLLRINVRITKQEV
ncbi:hypothetical protein Anas_06432, partial [Armadillidium nasatum]